MNKEPETLHLQDQASTQGFSRNQNPFVAMGNSANSRSRMTRLCDLASGDYLHLNGKDLTKDRNWSWLGNYRQADNQIKAWAARGYSLFVAGPR